VRADVDVTLDILRHLAAKVAFDLVALVDDLADLDHLIVAEIVCFGVERHSGGLEDLLRSAPPDPVDIRERNLHALVSRQIDSGYTTHTSLVTIPVSVYAVCSHTRRERRPCAESPCIYCKSS